MDRIGKGMWCIVKEMNKQNTEETGKRKIVKYVVFLLLAVAAVLVGMKAFMAPAVAERNPEWENYLGILSKTEKEQWLSKERESDGAYMQVNQIVLVDADGYTAELRFINPPYSACDAAITIKLKDNDTVIYRSEIIKPGTIVAEAGLNDNYSGQEGKAAAYFEFYDGRGKLIKEKELEIDVRPKEH